jgi:hypothetical protein
MLHPATRSAPPLPFLPHQSVFFALLHGGGRNEVGGGGGGNVAVIADRLEWQQQLEVSRALSALLVADLCVRPVEHKVVLLEPSIFPARLKLLVATALLRDLRCPALSFLREPAAICLSTARWTGLCVDAGFRDTRVTAVVHGQILAATEIGTFTSAQAPRRGHCRAKPG